MKPNLVIHGYPIHAFLGSGKAGDSYLISYHQSFAVLKVMHHRPFINHHVFTIEDEITSYRLLSHLGIEIPLILEVNKEEGYLIKTFIEGPTLAEYMIHHEIPIALYTTYYKTIKAIESAGYTIDYFPTNFIVSHCITYIDYEINPYQKRWSFLEWGIHFWFNKEGFHHYFTHEHDMSGLLHHMEESIPIQTSDPIKTAFLNTIKGEL